MEKCDKTQEQLNKKDSETQPSELLTLNLLSIHVQMQHYTSTNLKNAWN